MSTTEVNTWFGPASSPLFGTIHHPADGTARGAIVLCPPLGKEHIDTYRGMRLLAQKLARLGLLVLRFDYVGTGDSSGDPTSADAVSRWIDSIEQAVTFARTTGAGDVSLVGLRAGALLLSAAAGRCGPLRSVVLWDPVVAGRPYLREQRAFYQLSLGQDRPDNDLISIVGAELAPGAIDELGSLNSDALAPLDKSGADTRVLVVAREEQLATRSLGRLVARLNADVKIAVGHTEFVSPASFLVRIPSDTISHIAEWLSELADTVAQGVDVRERQSATFAGRDGLDVTETIERIGPNRLFAIRSANAAEASDRSAALVINPTANEHRVGVAGMWVKVARTLPQFGISVLRYDRRGTGDTGDVTDKEHTPVYSDESRADVVAAAVHSGVRPSELVLSGLCSGGWNAAYAAMEVGARGAVMANNIIWSTKRRPEFEGPIDPAVIDAIGTSENGAPDWRLRAKQLLRNHLPYPGWKLLGLRGVTQVPEVLLAALAAKNVKTTVILSPADHEWFVDQRGEEGLRRLERKYAPITVSVAERGDHSAYHRDMRSHLVTTLVTSVAAEFGSKRVEVAPAARKPIAIRHAGHSSAVESVRST
ncbi:serine aminopeptidase domain-containing protein [Actinomycetes bacterium M1A6_2h]